jgi:hypothetical protein
MSCMEPCNLPPLLVTLLPRGPVMLRCSGDGEDAAELCGLLYASCSQTEAPGSLILPLLLRCPIGSGGMAGIAADTPAAAAAAAAGPYSCSICCCCCC